MNRPHTERLDRVEEMQELIAELGVSEVLKVIAEAIDAKADAELDEIPTEDFWTREGVLCAAEASVRQLLELAWDLDPMESV